MRRLFVLASLVALALGCVLAWRFTTLSRPLAGGSGASSNVPQLGSEKRDSLELPTPSKSAREGEICRRLVEEGWQFGAANAVVELNAELFEILAEAAPAKLERSVQLLEALGRRPQWMPLLRDRPKVASLLAGQSDPDSLAELIEAAGDDYAVLEGFLLANAAPDDTTALTAGIQNHARLVYSLASQGNIGCESLFVFPCDDADAARNYANWLAAELERRAGDVDRMASFVQFASEKGAEIRSRMALDPRFQAIFSDTLWPKFARAVELRDGMFEEFVADVDFWDVVALDDWDDLAQEPVLVVIAAELLFDGRAVPYPPELRSRIVRLLLTKDPAVIGVLRKFHADPQLRRLTARRMADEPLRAVLQRLAVAGPAFGSKLDYFSSLSDAALAEEVGPPDDGVVTLVPLYSTLYAIPRKLAQGREISALEWVVAVGEPVLLAVDIASGGASKGPRDVALRTSLKGAARTAAEEGAVMAAKRLGAEVSRDAAANWTVTAAIGSIRRTTVEAWARGLTVDVTQQLKGMYVLSGAGRNTWKRMTGLEARVFMRRDARVELSFNGLVAGRLGALLSSLGEDAAIAAATKVEPVQGAVQAGAAVVHDSAISAWWLLNSADAVGVLETKKESRP